MNGDLGIRSLRGTREGVGPGSGGQTLPVLEGDSGPLSSVEGGQLLSVEEVGERIRILTVGRPTGFDFTAGQYVRLGYGDYKARKFSLASAPDELILEFCVGLNPDGSLTPALFDLQTGAQLGIGDSAQGGFQLDSSVPHHLMIATTTGIAPVRSMIREALGRGLRASFTVLHGASRPTDLPYRSEFEQLAAETEGVSYLPTISRPGDPDSAGWSGSVGRVEHPAIREVADVDRSRTCVYACGNPAMVANVVRHMRASGLRVRSEAF